METLYLILCSVVLDLSIIFKYLKLFVLFGVVYLFYNPKVLAVVLFFIIVWFFVKKKKFFILGLMWDIWPLLVFLNSF